MLLNWPPALLLTHVFLLNFRLDFLTLHLVPWPCFQDSLHLIETNTLLTKWDTNAVVLDRLLHEQEENPSIEPAAEATQKPIGKLYFAKIQISHFSCS